MGTTAASRNLDENPYWDWSLYGRWVLANAAAEGIGLGLAFLLGAAIAVSVNALFGTVAPLVVMLVAVLGGTFEGVVVGWGQWLVLRRPFPAISRRAWVLATAGGAFIAWVLGMLPSTLLDFSAAAGSVPAPEISDALQYLLAAGLGLVAGPVLACAQWLVLRKHVRKAGWWMPANALAWACAMPLTFVVAGNFPPGGITPGFGALMVGAIFLIGGIVGAVHGLALLWLAG
jgi:hypothetical protein